MATRTDTFRIPRAVIRSKKCRDAMFCSLSTPFPFTVTRFIDTNDFTRVRSNFQPEARYWHIGVMLEFAAFYVFSIHRIVTIKNVRISITIIEL